MKNTFFNIQKVFGYENSTDNGYDKSRWMNLQTTTLRDFVGSGASGAMAPPLFLEFTM